MPHDPKKLVDAVTITVPIMVTIMGTIMVTIGNPGYDFPAVTIGTAYEICGYEKS